MGAAFSPVPFIHEQVTEINISYTAASLEISFVPWLEKLEGQDKEMGKRIISFITSK